MPTPSVKISLRRTFHLLVLGALGLNIVTAQSAAPAAPATPVNEAAPAATPATPATPAAPPTATPASGPQSVSTSTAGGATDGLGNATGTGLDYLFNHRAAKGSVADNFAQAKEVAAQRSIANDAAGGKITDTQTMNAFLQFLGNSAVPADQLKDYLEVTDKVFQLLDSYQPDDAKHRNDRVEAWGQLPKLAKHTSLDSGISEELFNEILNITQAGRTTNTLAAQNVILNAQAKAAASNMDTMSQEIADQDLEQSKKQKQANTTGKGGSSNTSTSSNSGGSTSNTNSSGGGASSPSGGAAETIESLETAPTAVSSSLMGKMEITGELYSYMENKARATLNEHRANKLVEATEKQFADYITDLSKRRYNHNVIMAAKFYLRFFEEGDYPVDIADKVNTALSANRDAENAIDAFHNKISNNEVFAATNFLESAYLVDPFHPSLLSVPLEDKNKVEKFVRNLDKMVNMIQVKDYGHLDPLITELKQEAPDWDETKAQNLVSVAKQQSEMLLRRAAMLAQSKDPNASQLAMTAFEDAATAWPDNPDLKKFSDRYAETNDTVNQYLAEFDRLVGEKNYRAIFEKQLMFAPAMKDDPTRQDQLKDALMKIKNAEIAVEKANAMKEAGDYAGAWETIQLAVKDLPDDNKLNTMKADLTGRAAEFVVAINRAQDEEAKGNLGYSLTWYAIAQSHYPHSSLAKPAIERISKLILEKAEI